MELRFFIMLLLVCALVIISPAMLSNHVQIVLKESDHIMIDNLSCRGCDDTKSFESHVEMENEN